MHTQRDCPGSHLPKKNLLDRSRDRGRGSCRPLSRTGYNGLERTIAAAGVVLLGKGIAQSMLITVKAEIVWVVLNALEGM
jgi:hypothetical protein